MRLFSNLTLIPLGGFTVDFSVNFIFIQYIYFLLSALPSAAVTHSAAFYNLRSLLPRNIKFHFLAFPYYQILHS